MRDNAWFGFQQNILELLEAHFSFVARSFPFVNSGLSMVGGQNEYEFDPLVVSNLYAYQCILPRSSLSLDGFLMRAIAFTCLR